jgi:receptor-type tyrosine-protein phosphatase beta
LVPGRLYEITAWTVSGGVTSHPVLRQDRLYPEPVSAINATEISDTELQLLWKAPQGDWNAFEVEYLDYNHRLVKELTTKESARIGNLKPHRNYTFTVTVRSGNNGSELRVSLPMSSSFSTRESVPEKVCLILEHFHCFASREGHCMEMKPFGNFVSV